MIPVISLLGNSSLNVEQGSTYNDDGATATDNTMEIFLHQ